MGVPVSIIGVPEDETSEHWLPPIVHDDAPPRIPGIGRTTHVTVRAFVSVLPAFANHRFAIAPPFKSTVNTTAGAPADSARLEHRFDLVPILPMIELIPHRLAAPRSHPRSTTSATVGSTIRCPVVFSGTGDGELAPCDETPSGFRSDSDHDRVSHFTRGFHRRVDGADVDQPPYAEGRSA